MFHELVHAVQYEILGLDEFSRQYVRGSSRASLTTTGSHSSIAYDLDRRFSDNPGAAFSVLDEVQRLLKGGPS
jgi:hypothetical protein